MNIAAAALAAPSLHFSTGIAIAFASRWSRRDRGNWQKPKASSASAGQPGKAHITRRYASPFDKPAPQMKDYVRMGLPPQDVSSAGPLQHDGPYYKLSLYPAMDAAAATTRTSRSTSRRSARSCAGGRRGRRRHARPSLLRCTTSEPPAARPGRARHGPARSATIDRSSRSSSRPAIRRKSGDADQGSKTTLASTAPRPAPSSSTRPRGPARPLRLPQTGDARQQALITDDPQVRHRGALGRRRRPHDRALQGHRRAAGDLPRLALARGRSEDPRTLGRSGARGAQGGVRSKRDRARPTRRASPARRANVSRAAKQYFLCV